MTEQKKRKREQLDDQEVADLFVDIDKCVDHAKTLIREKKSRAEYRVFNSLAIKLGERLESAKEDLEVQAFDKPWGSLTNIEFRIMTYTHTKGGSLVLKFTDGSDTQWRLRASLKFVKVTEDCNDTDDEFTWVDEQFEFSVYHESPRRVAGESFIRYLRKLLIHLITEYGTFKPKIDKKTLRDAIHRSIRS